MTYFLGLDVGTSSTKAHLYTKDFVSVASSSVHYEMDQPFNGWAEQDPKIWKEAAFKVIEDCLSQLKTKPTELSIGLTGQMHGLVMLDEEDEVIRPAILWCDQRTDPQCQQMTQDLGLKTLIKETANPALTGFTASKILWVKDNEPEKFKACKKILLPKDYIRFCLSGDYATDLSDASGLQLLNVRKRTYSKPVLDYLGLRRDQLPKLYESTEITGFVYQDYQQAWGIEQPIAICAGAGDNAAAAIGLGVIEDGDTFITVGTSAVVFTQTQEMKQEPEGRVHSFCSAVPGSWHVMAVTQGAGSSITKAKQLFYPDKAFHDINREVAQVPLGSEKLIYLPYLLGERSPHLDPQARGVFFGISLLHQPQHFMRSVYEAIGFSLRDCLELLLAMGIQPKDLRITGGVTQEAMLVQLFSDILGEDMTQMSSEATTLGCALLSSVATGIYPNLKTAFGQVSLNNKAYKANSEVHEKSEAYYQLYRKIYLSLKDNFNDLDQIL